MDTLANRHPSRSLAVLALAVAVAAAGCQTNTGTVLDRKTTQGAILGTLAGAAAGAAIDKKDARGALIGAAVGGISGGVIGNYLDKQAQEIDAIPDANVERRGDALLVMFPGDLLYESNSASLAPGSYDRLRSLAETLRTYPETNVVVKGHTDGAGSDSYNMRLSEERADRVSKFLVSEAVESNRVTALGMGESLPVASNDTPEGRQQNRRVEIELRPSQSLRERAETQQGGTGN